MEDDDLKKITVHRRGTVGPSTINSVFKAATMRFDKEFLVITDFDGSETWINRSLIVVFFVEEICDASPTT